MTDQAESRKTDSSISGRIRRKIDAKVESILRSPAYFIRQLTILMTVSVLAIGGFVLAAKYFEYKAIVNKHKGKIYGIADNAIEEVWRNMSTLNIKAIDPVLISFIESLASQGIQFEIIQSTPADKSYEGLPTPAKVKKYLDKTGWDMVPNKEMLSVELSHLLEEHMSATHYPEDWKIFLPRDGQNNYTYFLGGVYGLNKRRNVDNGNEMYWKMSGEYLEVFAPKKRDGMCNLCHGYDEDPVVFRFKADISVPLSEARQDIYRDMGLIILLLLLAVGGQILTNMKIVGPLVSRLEKTNAGLLMSNKDLFRANEKLDQMNRDLLEVKAQLEEADMARKSLLRTVSHDLNSPLTAAQSNAQVLEMMVKKYITGLDEGKKAMLEDAVMEIRKGLTKLIQMTKKYLSRNAIESGGAEYNFTIFDIQNAVYSSIKYTSAFQDKFGVKVINEAVKAPFEITGDEGAVEQVVTNLVNNAIKYNHGKDGEEKWVRVKTRPLDNGVQVEVSDNGKGIAKENLDRIFDPYFREKGAKVEGFGAGLANCKKIVEDHGGWIKVQSEVGQGSIFTAYFPRNPEQPQT